MRPGALYTDGEYLKNNPTWDVEDAPWKADHILRMMQKHRIEPETICEIGCGCGEILRQLQVNMPESVEFTGYEISPQAYRLCMQRSNKRLRFRLKNYCDEVDNACDLILLIDLIEHLEDYVRFLRDIKGKCRYMILHIPLELFAVAAAYPQFLLGQRRKAGHLHFFSKDLALQVLRDAGYEIIDVSYTAGYALDRRNGIRETLLKVPRKILYPLAPDFTVNVFGGYSLLVLVR